MRQAILRLVETDPDAGLAGAGCSRWTSGGRAGQVRQGNRGQAVGRQQVGRQGVRRRVQGCRQRVEGRHALPRSGLLVLTNVGARHSPRGRALLGQRQGYQTPAGADLHPAQHQPAAQVLPGAVVEHLPRQLRVGLVQDHDAADRAVAVQHLAEPAPEVGVVLDGDVMESVLQMDQIFGRVVGIGQRRREGDRLRRHAALQVAGEAPEAEVARSLRMHVEEGRAPGLGVGGKVDDLVGLGGTEPAEAATRTFRAAATSAMFSLPASM